jgi:signal transduction histidine kinase
MLVDSARSSVWVWRPLPLGADEHGTILANLDITGFVDERQRLYWSLLLADLLFSAACAALGFFLARQLQRPLALMTDHLVLAEGDLPQPVAQRLIPAHDPQIAKLIHAFNRMAENAAQREAMLGRLVDQERDAVLGRLAATLAHEIRNPLGGIATAIGTLRKFGAQPEARTEAIDFIERGVVALQEVTDATLKTHRPASTTRRLRLQDLHDVRLLAAADASRRDVDIDLELDIPAEVAVPATEVRQLLLNLLLNAVRATSPGGTVTLRCLLQEDVLLLEVIDQGQGLTADVAGGMISGRAPPGNPGLGVAVIVRLVERLQGQVSVNARSEGGTHIALRLPLGAAAFDPGGAYGGEGA